MKKKSLSLIIGIVALFVMVVGCKDDPVLPEPQPIQLVGKIVGVPNPCLTKPCLPGIVAAIATDSINYILSIKGQWCADGEVIMNNDTFRINDHLEAFGVITKKQDIELNSFYEIEVTKIIRK